MAAIDTYFDILIEKEGSDLHLAEGQPPKIRIHGEILPIDETILTHEQLGGMMQEICPENKFKKYL
ncbi:MAG: type IV pili twitching motility protein PilT, partial [Planctomycetes bacterium]|nr:type IV pili twitching motility protein PilT [Planctomycetota bacterium]